MGKMKDYCIEHESYDGIQRFVSFARFVCPSCEEHTCTNIEVPEFDFSGDKPSDMANGGTIDVKCPQCKKVFDGYAHVSPHHCSIELTMHPDTTISADLPYYDPPSPEYYEIDAALDEDSAEGSLHKSLTSMEQLLKEKELMDNELQKFQLMMIYGFCITSLESYLSDAFARRVFKDSVYKDKYLQSEDTLKNKKFPLSELYQEYKKVDATIKLKISNTSFHSLEKVKGLYKSVLGIDLGDVSDLVIYIRKRHDFVHRGGKNTHGEKVTTSKEEVKDLISKVKELCNSIKDDIDAIDGSSELEEMWKDQDNKTCK